VLYGTSSGLSANRTQLWTRDDPNVRGTADAYDYFGSSVTCADFNGDGFADLAIGVPFSDPSGEADAGTVSVIFGSPSGLQASGSGGPDDQLLGQNTPDPDDQMGRSLAACDFNGDGHADLAVGVPGEDLGNVHDAGKVKIFYGSSGGLDNGEFWTQDSAGVRDSAETGDKFGSRLACGDANGDGFDDLAVGVPSEDTTLADVGIVQVLFGSSGGLQATSPDDQRWSQNSPGVLDSAQAGDAFGGTLSAGDFNDDGFTDLAIGVSGETVNSEAGAGAMNVLFGSSGGLSSTGNEFWHQNSSGVPDMAELNDFFGALGSR